MFDRRAAWLAGLMLAFDPFMVFFSSLLLTETLFVAVVVLLWGVGWAYPAGGGQGRIGVALARGGSALGPVRPMCASRRWV